MKTWQVLWSSIELELFTAMVILAGVVLYILCSASSHGYAWCMSVEMRNGRMASVPRSIDNSECIVQQERNTFTTSSGSDISSESNCHYHFPQICCTKNIKNAETPLNFKVTPGPWIGTILSIPAKIHSCKDLETLQLLGFPLYSTVLPFYCITGYMCLYFTYFSYARIKKILWYIVIKLKTDLVFLHQYWTLTEN